jgi:hypothetical protein
MASNINPTSIDGTYPIAGQDNDSQGFRDNFTNTRTNFDYAKTEISDLQSKVVLKSALTGTTLNNDFNGAIVKNVKLQGTRLASVALGTITGSQTIDVSAGHYYSLTTSGSVTLAFSNWASTGSLSQAQVSVVVSSVAHTLTLPAAVSAGTTGIQGYSSNVITFANTGTYVFNFTTTNNGSSISMQDISRPLLGSVESAVGYSTGTGGTVTQATSKSAGVTLNKRCGRITLNNAALAAGGEVSFTLTNSTISATDVIVMSIASGATAATYTAIVDAVAAGSCRISIGNYSSASASEVIVLNFVVIKSVSA